MDYKQIDGMFGWGCEQDGVWGWDCVEGDWVVNSIGVDWVGLGLGCDWAIVCGVCYYRELLQMQHFHPEPRPRLVMANSADNTC